MQMLRNALVIFMLASVVGCATAVKPGVTKNTQKIELNNESIVILTAELTNQFKPAYQPNAKFLVIEAKNAGKSEVMTMAADNDSVLPGKQNTYVFTGMLKPGKYILRGVNGLANTFPIWAQFFAPLHAEITVDAGKVIDLGKITAVVRERKGNEFRAGPVLPLIDQAVAGFSGGTFDVSTSPQQTDDIQQLKSMYPALNGVAIIAQTLPPFDRGVAQSWWEAH